MVFGLGKLALGCLGFRVWGVGFRKKSGSMLVWGSVLLGTREPET